MLASMMIRSRGGRVDPASAHHVTSAIDELVQIRPALVQVNRTSTTSRSPPVTTG